MPFISIIIPTFNRAIIIESTIKSVLNQNFKDWELIIVDDGSTDNTKQVIGTFEDPRIKYIYQENAERGAARNNGVKQSKGDYVFFLDSDDIIYPNHLELAFEELEKLEKPEFFHIRYEEQYSNFKKPAPLIYSKSIKSRYHSWIPNKNKGYSFSY